MEQMIKQLGKQKKNVINVVEIMDQFIHGKKQQQNLQLNSQQIGKQFNGNQ